MRGSSSDTEDDMPKPLSAFEEDNRFNALSDSDREENDQIKAREADAPIEDRA